MIKKFTLFKLFRFSSVIFDGNGCCSLTFDPIIPAVSFTISFCHEYKSKDKVSKIERHVIVVISVSGRCVVLISIPTDKKHEYICIDKTKVEISIAQ